MRGDAVSQSVSLAREKQCVSKLPDVETDREWCGGVGGREEWRGQNVLSKDRWSVTS